jgi:MFS family permease
MFRSKGIESKSYLNLNYASLIFIYLAYSSIFVFLNNYFPILFFDVLNINRVILALMQFLAYSILLFRPAFATITDKYKIKGYQRKYYMIFSGYILVVFYIFLGFTFNNVLLIGIFLLFIFFSSTMLDVSTKSLIIDNSPNNDYKKKAFFFITVGGSLGNAIPYLLYILLINDIYSINSWMVLLFYSSIFLLPLFFILPFINEKNNINSRLFEYSKNYEFLDKNNRKINQNFKKSFILLSIFVFLAFSDVIFSYPFFPFLINKFGPIKFYLFNFFLIFYFILSIFSTALGTFFMKRIKPKKMILTLIPSIGIIYIIYSFVDFTLFFLLYFIANALGIITNLNISVYIMKFKKGGSTTYFHLIASFKNLAFFIFIPIGTALSIIITTETLFMIGAVLLNLSLIPLILIKF